MHFPGSNQSISKKERDNEVCVLLCIAQKGLLLLEWRDGKEGGFGFGFDNKKWNEMEIKKSSQSTVFPIWLELFFFLSLMNDK